MSDEHAITLATTHMITKTQTHTQPCNTQCVCVCVTTCARRGNAQGAFLLSVRESHTHTHTRKVGAREREACLYAKICCLRCSRWSPGRFGRAGSARRIARMDKDRLQGSAIRSNVEATDRPSISSFSPTLSGMDGGHARRHGEHQSPHQRATRSRWLRCARPTPRVIGGPQEGPPPPSASPPDALTAGARWEGHSPPGVGGRDKSRGGVRGGTNLKHFRQNGNRACRPSHPPCMLTRLLRTFCAPHQHDLKSGGNPSADATTRRPTEAQRLED